MPGEVSPGAGTVVWTRWARTHRTSGALLALTPATLPVFAKLIELLVPTHKKRTHEVFTLCTSCMAHGNEPVTTTICSGVALLLEMGAGVC